MYLPIDSLCHKLHNVLPSLRKYTSMLPTVISGQVRNKSPKGFIDSTVRREWYEFSSPSSKYEFGTPDFIPEFINLSRFIASRIHQIRAGSSYLAIHPTRFNKDQDRNCPKCGLEYEDFRHAIITCPARKEPCLKYISDIKDVGPSSPLWKSRPQSEALAVYIREIKTGFPYKSLPIEWRPKNNPLLEEP